MINAIPSSYRDPGGFVFKYDGLFYRIIKYNYQKEYDFLMSSGLYEELVSKKLLISHREYVLPEQVEPDTYKTILPEQIHFISYPYEWCFDQWKDVLLAFLEINRISLSYGLILKDATPFNFTFHKGKPVFIDTLSFSFYKEGKPWLAYRQFCESLLGPLVLMKYNGALWSSEFASSINGFPLTFISKQLSWKTYFKPIVLIHIHLHAKYSSHQISGKKGTSGMNKSKILALMEFIRQAIVEWNPLSDRVKNWNDYYTTKIISQSYLTEKEEIVEYWIRYIKPSQLVDFGANTGNFSIIAAQYSESVISVESDSDCVNKFYCANKNKSIQKITPIVADIMQLSPGVGWDNMERMPLVKRIHADTVLALALIHHLCIGSNLPIGLFASFISSIVQRYAIIEFIPKTDPKIQEMLASRYDIFQNYSEAEFVKQFEEYFELEDIRIIASVNRTLYLWRKK